MTTRDRTRAAGVTSVLTTTTKAFVGTNPLESPKPKLGEKFGLCATIEAPDFRRLGKRRPMSLGRSEFLWLNTSPCEDVEEFCDLCAGLCTPLSFFHACDDDTLLCARESNEHGTFFLAILFR